MLNVTERAADQLEEVRSANEASPDQGVRLTPDERGGIGMTVDAPHDGDEVIHRGDEPLVIVDSRITEFLDGAELDCELDVDAQLNGRPGPHFMLRRPEQGTQM
jgi:Fe-S cluster assembly iron-binding protein IscA